MSNPELLQAVQEARSKQTNKQNSYRGQNESRAYPASVREWSCVPSSAVPCEKQQGVTAQRTATMFPTATLCSSCLLHVLPDFGTEAGGRMGIPCTAG